MCMIGSRYDHRINLIGYLGIHLAVVFKNLRLRK